MYGKAMEELQDDPDSEPLIVYDAGRVMLRLLFLVGIAVALLVAVLPALRRAPAGRLAFQRGSAISAIFTPEVQYWAADINRWAQAYGVDADMVATIMQIESCGHPTIASPAGAQGLFQVMPFHFESGENPLDPETNARRSLDFLIYLLRETGGNTALTFAGYNGGPGAALGNPQFWANETRDYYHWSTTIYADAKAGVQPSPALQAWLDAGGSGLCRLAAAQLQILSD